MDKSCSKCAYYATPSCIGADKRQILIEDYEHDCFTTEEDKLLCELMCGGIEEDGEEM